jgi:hypothetical protein
LYKILHKICYDINIFSKKNWFKLEKFGLKTKSTWTDISQCLEECVIKTTFFDHLLGWVNCISGWRLRSVLLCNLQYYFLYQSNDRLLGVVATYLYWFGRTSSSDRMYNDYIIIYVVGWCSYISISIWHLRSTDMACCWHVVEWRG